MTTREIIYSGHTILGAVFTLSAWKIFAIASAAACVCLVFTSWILGLHSIPITAGHNEGFLYTYNWSIMYTLVIPLLLAMAVAVSERMKNCVVKLCDDGRITSKEPGAPSYPEALSEHLRSKAKKLVISTAIIAIFVTLLDTSDLWIGFIGDQVPASRNPGWDTAFNARNWGSEYDTPDFFSYQQNPPSRTQNFFFDAIAYLFQGTAFFLGLFWIGKFTLYLLTFARLMGGNDSSYQFNPLTHDLDSRMGLKPMGGLFNSFLGITLVLVIYAFFHRLYLIDTGRKKPFGDYLSTTFWNIIQPKDSPFQEPLNHFAEIFKADSWGFDGLDISAFITIFFMTVPMVVICFLPLWKIRSVVNKRRGEELERLQKVYEEAMKKGKFDRVQLVKHSKESLENANIWPNGNATAKGYLTLIFALGAGALAPPLLAIILVLSFSDRVAKFFKLIFKG